MPKVILLKNVSHTSHGQQILDNVSLEIKEGHLVTVSGGPSKSYLMRILAGAEAPESGEVRVLGSNPASQDFRHRADTFYVHEDFQMTFPVTLREKMQIYQQVFPRWSNKDFSRLLKERGFGFETFFLDLSLAQRNEFLLIMALAARPRLLFLDESALKLDNLSKNFYFQYLKAFSDQGGTALIASNKSAALRELSDHHLAFMGPKLIDQGQTQGPGLFGLKTSKKAA
jgi:ABC-2 type transport system ATP-binding protein